MSITDELRKYAQRFMNSHDAWSGIGYDLDSIADRIDTAHKHAIGYVDDRDLETMAENGWVKLPVDVDGMPIRIGDVMENLREDLEPRLHHTFRVYGIHYRDYGQECALTEDGYPTILYRVSECRHYHEPTVEDVLTNFGIDWEYENDCEDRAALLKEYAAKLCLADDGKE